jgi:Kef-type K+ transport system membrane component KefB
MFDLHLELSLLARFALAFGLAILLPKFMDRIGLPPVLGFIAAGALLGPAVVGILKPDSPAIELLSEVGKLLFMFFVGFEINLEEFKKTRSRALGFGLLTFLLPLAGGMALARLTGSNWNSALLIGSLIASHTLLAFGLSATSTFRAVAASGGRNGRGWDNFHRCCVHACFGCYG